jgi:hypothetical protein
MNERKREKGGKFGHIAHLLFLVKIKNGIKSFQVKYTNAL